MDTNENTHHANDTPSRNTQTATEIRGIMAAKRYTTADLAKQLGISRSSASRRLDGKKPLTLEEVGAIAEWLGVSYGRLLTPGNLAYTA